MLDFDLEDSDDEPGAFAVTKLQCDEVKAVSDNETEVSTRDGNASENEETADEGTEQYWKLKLKEGTLWKVAVIYLVMRGLLTQLFD